MAQTVISNLNSTVAVSWNRKASKGISLDVAFVVWSHPVNVNRLSVRSAGQLMKESIF